MATGPIERRIEAAMQARNQALFAVDRLQHVDRLLAPKAAREASKPDTNGELTQAAALAKEAAEAVTYLQALLAELRGGPEARHPRRGDVF